MKHALEIDRNIGNKLWKYALSNKMTKVGVSFEVLEEVLKDPIG